VGVWLKPEQQGQNTYNNLVSFYRGRHPKY
jgi:hypothetical protein